MTSSLTSRCGCPKADVSCLEYLYGETIKLDQRMAAHLIGAVAEALRNGARTQARPTGGET